MKFLSSLASPTIILAVILMAVIVMMILPVPAAVLDVGLAASFGLAILIFTITLFIERPLQFSSFPVLLLAALMLRLSLNVSSTKLIIGEGHTGTDAAGDVIQGFAAFIMSGSLLIGIIVFLVLLIVNFMVITKGASRMAEVSARFALDGMPGKQLAIDADMAAGAITHQEAKLRRETDQQETTFFGSLDGASKFVKGDAVAGLLITALNLLMGMIVGIFVHDMPLARAVETYSILTVGDGLVTQIPAVIISVAAGLLLARGGTVGATDKTVTEQIARHPHALMAVAILLFLFALVPGLPFLPFLFGSLTLGATSLYLLRKIPDSDEEQAEEIDDDPVQERIGDLLDVDDIHVEFAPDLVGMVLDPSTGLDLRIENMRKYVGTNYGLILPEIRLTDAAILPTGVYCIRIHGVEMARGELNPDMVMALAPDDMALLPPGNDVSEPVYGAPSRWISPLDQEKASLDGITIVTPSEILATHLLEVVRKNFGRLLTLKTLKKQLHEICNISNESKAQANKRLIDDLIPEKIKTDFLLQVLRLLLKEHVSIRNLPLILEAMVEAQQVTNSPEAVCEQVRQKLGFQMVSEFKRPDGTIPLLQLSPEWEDMFRNYQVESENGTPQIALPPESFDTLVDGITSRLNELQVRGVNPAILTSSRRRRFLKTLIDSRGIIATVLSHEELGLEAKPSIVGVIPT
ncbi:flagellar biosynthesis protein FlhA [Cognatishimia sp. F0-27]|uniref:flagellar biosynthesis protein FlhA n=1 Tax=Cognatishimia sp. F0-27 TaxID=2816855 RepID=UPI001D0C5168|nr:flagellar biosynthesis protein FlhA [Cognatishimia sp. F0-27]MCC1495112.1 flagellar biosynthesis protein FlhA [Cognatishimia sp. F0-27]